MKRMLMKKISFSFVLAGLVQASALFSQTPESIIVTCTLEQRQNAERYDRLCAIARLTRNTVAIVGTLYIFDKYALPRMGYDARFSKYVDSGVTYSAQELNRLFTYVMSFLPAVKSEAVVDSKIKNKTQEVIDAGKQLAQVVTDQATEKTNTVKAAIGQVADTIRGGITAAVDKVTEIKDKAVQTVASQKDEAAEKAAQLSEEVKARLFSITPLSDKMSNVVDIAPSCNNCELIDPPVTAPVEITPSVLSAINVPEVVEVPTLVELPVEVPVEIPAETK